MKNVVKKISTCAIVFVFLCGFTAGSALAGAENNPVDENWWPSEHGAQDRAGGTNWISPESRIAAARLVKLR